MENFFLGLALFVLAVVVFIPAFKAGFIWDDDQLLTANPQVHSDAGWWTLWLRPETADYFPLTSSTLWLEYHLGHWFNISLWNIEFLQHFAGQDILNGYHIMNVLYHAAAVVLTWQMLKRLRIPGAWIAAAIFAVHPVCVESVAWISERKNTISQIFLLLTIIHYVRFEEKGKLGRYIAAIICFGLSLLAKTAVVMLPFILLMLAWWRKSDWEPLREGYELEKNPTERGILVVSSAVAGAIGAALAVLIALLIPLYLHAPQADKSLVVLLGKVQTGEIPVNFWTWFVTLFGSAVVGGGLGYVVGLQLRKLKVNLAGLKLWDSFAGFEIIRALPFLLMAFVLGLVTFYFQNGRAIGGEEIPLGNLWQRAASACFAAGFYLYSAFWPFNLIEIYPQWHRAFSEIVTLPTWHIQPPAPESIPYYLQAVPGLVIAGVLALCWVRRSATWARAILVGLGCYVVAILPALGMMKMSYMRLTLVADHFQYISIVAVIALVVAAGTTRALKPLWLGVAALFYIVVTWLNWGQTEDNHVYAIIWIAGVLALAIGVGLKELWTYIWGGFALVVLLCFSFMTWAQAENYYSEKTLWSATLDKNQTSWQAHNHLGAALYMEQKWKEAHPHFLAATILKPENPESHNNLGLTLSLYGRIDEAIQQFEIAVFIKPDSAMMTNLANAYEQVKRFDDAIATYKKALALNPTNASAYCNMGYAQMQQGKIDEAISNFMKTIEIDPSMPQGPADLYQALIAKGINVNAPLITGTYSFDANHAVQLLREHPPRPAAQPPHP